MYADALTFSGFRALEASSGLEALQLAIDRLPDLILMDLSLPGMDGWEVTSRLKKDARTKHIPIIALTAHALDRGARARRAGRLRRLPRQALPPRRTPRQRSSGCWPRSIQRPSRIRRPNSDQPLSPPNTEYTDVEPCSGCRASGTLSRPMGNDIEFGRPRASGLVEVLDRVLDKGLFIGGDIKNLAGRSRAADDPHPTHRVFPRQGQGHRPRLVDLRSASGAWQGRRGRTRGARRAHSCARAAAGGAHRPEGCRLQGAQASARRASGAGAQFPPIPEQTLTNGVRHAR